MEFDMINNVEFPEGITFEQRYITGADLVSDGYNMIKNLSGLYKNSLNYVVDIKFDTSDISVNGDIFYDCSARDVKGLNISPTNTSAMFRYSKIALAPYFDTSKITDMSNMFYACTELCYVPQYDFRSVTNISSFFGITSNILSFLPDINCVSVKNFGSSYNSWLYSIYNLRRIGVVDCDSVTDIRYALGNVNNVNLLYLGGFRNLGKATSVTGTDSTYFLNYAPNLTYESIINVLNGLYDRASAGMSVLTLKLHANHLSQLTEDDIAIATNKGWNLI